MVFEVNYFIIILLFFGSFICVKAIGKEQSVEIYGKLQCCHFQEETSVTFPNPIKCINVTIAHIRLKDSFSMWFDSTLQEIHLEETDHYLIAFKGTRWSSIKPYIEAYIECPFGLFEKTSDILGINTTMKYDIIAGNC